jgi:hypothetical protein
VRRLLALWAVLLASYLAGRLAVSRLSTHAWGVDRQLLAQAAAAPALQAVAVLALRRGRL